MPEQSLALLSGGRLGARDAYRVQVHRVDSEGAVSAPGQHGRINARPPPAWHSRRPATSLLGATSEGPRAVPERAQEVSAVAIGNVDVEEYPGVGASG
jgi:hypothetical protein